MGLAEWRRATILSAEVWTCELIALRFKFCDRSIEGIDHATFACVTTMATALLIVVIAQIVAARASFIFC
ncbi:hypothetical protein K3165_01550 [Qipengyuania sp. 1XM1-15A]|uniref:hypothetical protein n=1 Tax=Qipengyuania xiamenensis TaxID=2867237 RepID=UPI001C88CD1D|nr:hypothetical protein [Qipengyuania xiamenensis]MBX7531604.1 hypothetical protein [Qipengyuania xiamenensis]